MDVQQIVLAIVLPVMMICVFSFASVAMWVRGRRKEREALYRSDAIKKMAESAGAGGTTVLDLLREEERTSRARRREGYKLGGLVAVAAGVGMMAFLSVFARKEPIFMVGLIPVFVGVALLVYVFLVGPRD